MERVHYVTTSSIRCGGVKGYCIRAKQNECLYRNLMDSNPDFSMCMPYITVYFLSISELKFNGSTSIYEYLFPNTSVYQN